MKNLQQLLNRFNKRLNKDSLIKEEIIKTIKDLTQVGLSSDVVQVNDGVLEITATSGAKNEIKIKEEKIKMVLETKQIFIRRVLYK